MTPHSPRKVILPVIFAMDKIAFGPKINNMWTYFSRKNEFCRNLNMILTISSVVDNFYTQVIDDVDKNRKSVEIQGIFCYDYYVFVVDYGINPQYYPQAVDNIVNNFIPLL